MRTHSLVRRATRLLLVAGLATGAAPSAYATVASPDPGAALLPEAPITSVVVYSDRARVTRSARVKLAGTQQVALPLLQGSVESSSIRLDAQGAEVLRVETSYVDTSDLPVDEAQRLLGALEKLDDELGRRQGELAVYRAQLDLLRRITPSVPPQAADPQRPPARLNATGWSAVMAFFATALERLQVKVADGEEQLRTLRRQRQDLVDKARLLGGIEHRAGYRVVATLSGQGAAQVALTYMTAGARWLPTYDIQLLPAQNRVELALSGLVSQETGEDWNDTALVLSTAVPATATQLPKLFTWKIGERERFIPTPRPLIESMPPPPRVPALPETYSAVAALRAQLLARSGLSDERSRRIQLPEEQREGVSFQSSGENLVPADEKKPEPMTGKDQVNGELRQSVRSRDKNTPDPELPMTAAPSMSTPVMMDALRGKQPSADRDGDGVLDKEDRAEEVSIQRTSELLSTNRARPRGPIASVGLVPPAGYRAPHYAANLPAALAGGYDLSYPSLAKDTIKSGQGSRRVALLARSFPVAVLRKVLPALAPEAFLVAELKNPATEPLPGGQANLFVGADPAGVATLQLIAPGETFTLPLGLDRAVKPIRNVRLSTEEKGVFSKDEITEYVVTTELVNPYGVPLELKLLDQIPLPGDKNVEIKLVRSQPAAVHDPLKGSLEWKLALPPGSKLVTQFVYTLRRPKGYRLNQ